MVRGANSYDVFFVEDAGPRVQFTGGRWSVRSNTMNCTRECSMRDVERACSNARRGASDAVWDEVMRIAAFER